MMERVFVYGTLKQGQPNHHHFLPENGKSVFIGKGRTVDKWPLVVATRFNIPFLLDLKDKGKHVFGELYEVDDQILQKLDELEDHPNLYVRTKIGITLVGKPEAGEYLENEVLSVWCYRLPKFTDQLLEYDMHESYSADAFLVEDETKDSDVDRKKVIIKEDVSQLLQ